MSRPRCPTFRRDVENLRHQSAIELCRPKPCETFDFDSLTKFNLKLYKAYSASGIRRGLGYSKDIETHKMAVALHFGVCNFVRKHKTLGTTPAVAAGVELEPWSLEQVVEMTANYLHSKEDAELEKAFAETGI